jgi:[protein-PII] uridylyltransferase
MVPTASGRNPGFIHSGQAVSEHRSGRRPRVAGMKGGGGRCHRAAAGGETDAGMTLVLPTAQRRTLAPPAALPEPAALAGEIEALLATGKVVDQAALVSRLKEWLRRHETGLRRQFEADNDAEVAVFGRCRLIDAVLRGLLDLAHGRVFRMANPTAGERLVVAAVGGYGRGELAPYSDVDLLFLHPYKRTPHTEQMIEFLLYKLWDLGLKVGQATRSTDECVRHARNDLQICTSLLEARFLWGDRALFDEFAARFEDEVVAGRGRTFVEAKLAERDARHQRTGDSRYLLEPNIKEGKGGLRDLQTLFWLGRFLYRIEQPDELVAHGVLNQATLRQFGKARRFLWAVRCHLHYLTDRPEERLTFDLQPEVARRMGYRDRKTSRSVERFMKHYYLVAKEVGALTRIFCAALEEQHRRRPRLGLARLGLGRRRIDGMIVQGGRIAPATPDLFERQPIAMLQLFQLAQERDLDIHPEALRAVTQSLRRVDAELRKDPAANALFLKMLTARKDPATALRRMNEAGLLGRFLPEFGRVVAQMEHSLYHVYTIDEHTIRAIGVLHQIEAGELESELPLATSLMPKVLSRTELYTALLFHDLGKARGGDHSEIGAQLVRSAGPRLGLSDEQIETVSWLVRHHLLLSRVAFKRDIEDPKTVADLVDIIQSPERLRLLLVLTAADIRAVGPNVWNGWKGQLLRDIYHEADAAIAGGDASGRRRDRVEAAKRALAAALADWPADEVERFLARHDPRYWVSFDLATHQRHAELVREAEAAGRTLTLDFRSDRFRARTEVVLFAPDHPGLFMKVAGALALSGASIVDARIFTTTDGMALDSFGIQDVQERGAVDDPARLARIRHNVERALAGEIWLDQALAGRRSLPQRADVFEVEPRVLIDNAASRTHTVLELNGRDRPGLLYEVAKTLKDLGMVISSAHISTYGERVVDVFYVKDVFGLKIIQPAKMRQIQRRLTGALSAGVPAAAVPAASRKTSVRGG